MPLTKEQQEILAQARSVHGPRCKAIGAKGGVFLVVRPPKNEDRAEFNESAARAGVSIGANVLLAKACVVHPEGKEKVQLFDQFPFLPDTLKKVIQAAGGSEVEELSETSLPQSEAATLAACREKRPDCVPLRCKADGTFLVIRRADPAERTRFGQSSKIKGFKSPDQTIAYEQLARALTLSPDGNAKTDMFERLPFLFEAVGDFGISMSGAEIEELGND